MTPTAEALVAAHERSGRYFEAGGVRSFALEDGPSSRRREAVVMLHGVPTSSFLYRKVVPLVAAEGLRAVAFDLPGLGLADRPPGYDYSWSGLARFVGQAIDALEIERCHLVIHDIGGPIGAEWAIRHRDRVASLTALNTLLNVATFRRPWTMHPFSIKGVGEAWMRAANRWVFSELFYLQGIRDRSAVRREEVVAHLKLLKRGDGGRAFLQVMRGYQLTDAYQRFLWEGLAAREYPAQVVWGGDDPALGRKHLRIVCDVLAVDDPVLVAAKHFPQEDQAPAVAAAIGSIAAASAS